MGSCRTAAAAVVLLAALSCSECFSLAPSVSHKLALVRGGEGWPWALHRGLSEKRLSYGCIVRRLLVPGGTDRHLRAAQVLRSRVPSVLIRRMSGYSEGEEGKQGTMDDEDPGDEDQEESKLQAIRRRLAEASLHPLIQFALGCAAFAFHVFILCKKTVTLPFNLAGTGGDPTKLSWEVVFGIPAIIVYLALLGGKGRAQAWAVERGEEAHYHFVKEQKKNVFDILLLLGCAYVASGYVGHAVNLALIIAAGLGVPLTFGMCHSLQVLLSHLIWVWAGSTVLSKRTSGGVFQNGSWFRWDTNIDRSGTFLWAVVGGYWLTSFASSFFISMNPLLLRVPVISQVLGMLQRIPTSQTELIVNQLKNPKGGDIGARIVGCIGPCFTGPVWEEVLYRGFLLQAIAMFCSLPTAVDVTSLIFALNHMNARAFAHLYVLGWIWSVMYLRTRNLAVPIVIHMMWNMRTFLSPV